MVESAFLEAAGPATTRPESVSDAGLLDDLAMSCAPLRGVLPDAMVRRQAELQRTGHESAYPEAMRQVVLRGDRPVGRLVIDWAPAGSRCVDVAILPGHRGGGLGTALLRAWLATADALALPAVLSVRRDNPAVALYRRLGLVEHDDPAAPLLTMSHRR